MILIDGKKIAAELREELKKNVAELKSKYDSVPGLTVILVGDKGVEKIVEINLDTKEKENFNISIKAVRELFNAATKIDSDLK